jgi:hypothetical protein
MTKSETGSWTCPSCKLTISSAYCPTCGERPLRARDLTLRGLFDQFTQAVTSIDGRLIRTFRYLIGRPGFLTVAYLRGQRKPFVGPVQLFLLANVLFFATESLAHGKIFTTPLDSHLHTQPWSGFAQTLVNARVAATHTTVDLYAPVFDKAVAVNARSLIIFMALSFTPVPLIVFPRTKLPFVVHALFSLHLYAFMLLLFCIATAVPPVDSWLGGAGFASETLDHTLAIALLIACAIYLYFATNRVYGAAGAIRVFQVVALTVGVAGIILGYRFILLLFTLYVA